MRQHQRQTPKPPAEPQPLSARSCGRKPADSMQMLLHLLPENPPATLYVQPAHCLRLLSVEGCGKLLLTAHEGRTSHVVVPPCIIWDASLLALGEKFHPGAPTFVEAAKLAGGRTYSLECQPLTMHPEQPATRPVIHVLLSLAP